MNFNKPTLQYGNLTLVKDDKYSLVVTDYKGEKIPFRSSTLYAKADGSVDRNIHQRITPHPNENITNARTEVLEIPADVILEYFSEYSKWDNDMKEFANVNSKQKADTFKEEYDKLHDEFIRQVNRLMNQNEIYTYDEDDYDFKVYVDCPKTGRKVEFVYEK